MSCRRINFIVSLLLISCNSTVSLESDLNKSSTALVFIHGIMGSRLVDQSNQQVWLGPGHGLNFSTPNLSLPLIWKNSIQKRDQLKPQGVVQDVTLAFGLIGKQIYGPWSKAVRQMKHKKYYVFAYDWRRDNNESANKFVKFLKQVKKQHKSVQVVAHSMGGMITWVAMNEHPDLINKVVFVAVPFRGGPGYLDNMFLGTPIGLNKEILSARVLFSHPSVYAFYPAGLAYENKYLTLDEKGNPLGLDFHDIRTWQKQGFGIYARQNQNTFTHTRIEVSHLKKSLAQARLFRQRMRPRIKAYPPVLVVNSKSHLTIDKIKRKTGNSKDKVPEWDFDSVPKVAGDGSVTYMDSLPPIAMPYRIYQTDYEHSYMLNDPEVQNKIADFLKQ